MTREEKRVKIAEAFPQCICCINGNWFYAAHVIGQPMWRACVENDPFQDLNAMYEAEKVLTDGQHRHFRRILAKVCLDGNRRSLHSRKLVSATAEQRAEVFGLALNLWKEGE